MTTTLIEDLNRLAGKTPDEIAVRLRPPFSQWRLGKYMTIAEHRQYGDLAIVLLSTGFATRPSRAELDHTVRKWTFYSHWQDWLGTDYYVRSLESYNANPDECPDPNSEFCRR